MRVARTSGMGAFCRFLRCTLQWIFLLWIIKSFTSPKHECSQTTRRHKCFFHHCFHHNHQHIPVSAARQTMYQQQNLNSGFIMKLRECWQQLKVLKFCSVSSYMEPAIFMYEVPDWSYDGCGFPCAHQRAEVTERWGHIRLAAIIRTSRISAWEWMWDKLALSVSLQWDRSTSSESGCHSHLELISPDSYKLMMLKFSESLMSWLGMVKPLWS